MAAYSEGKLHVFITKELIALERLGQKQDSEPSTLLLIPVGECSCALWIKRGQTQLCQSMARPTIDSSLEHT